MYLNCGIKYVKFFKNFCFYPTISSYNSVLIHCGYFFYTFLTSYQKQVVRKQN